ncbi:MAG TPA: hypothetical protein VN372_10915 [Methanospirillum sp.]|nr:hypothetical protein [Methanospirillum sp.]
MTTIEFLLIFIFAVILLFLVYYFFKGSYGNIAISRPVESRVDEYLDRRFEKIVEQWSLVRRPDLHKFTSDRNETLDRDEERIRMLKNYENDMKSSLIELEDRLNALEESLTSEKSGSR